MPWRIDGQHAIFSGSDTTWSIEVNRATAACRLLGVDHKPVAALASGETYPNAALAIRVDGAWRTLGTPSEAVINDAALRLSWTAAKVTARVDADPDLGVRWRISAEDAEAVALSLVAEADEHYYGLGERFNKLDQRGDLVELWVKNGASGGDTYKPAPFIASSRGYGLAIDTSRRVFAALAHPMTPTVSTITVEGPELTAWLIPGPAPVDVVRRYTAWIGRPPVPPEWFFRPWKSRDWRQEDQSTVLEDIRAQQEHGIPCGVKLIDATWETEGHNFRFDATKYPDVPGMMAALREADMELVLWFSPSMTAGTEDYDEAARRGYLITDSSGAPYLHRLGNAPGWEGTTIDFSNPAAVAWWQDGLRSLLELGVRGFKTDFGEQTPEDAHFANGKTGAEMHNLLPVLYNEASWEIVKEYDGALLARSAWAGSQRFSGIWAGDQSADFSPWGGLPTAIVAGQSAGWSGFPYWGSDVGGYFNPPDDEVFARWAAFGAVSPVMEAHGLGPREAWLFSPETLGIYRRFARLHDHLVPYTMAAATEAEATGLPIMRAMALLFPEHDLAHADWVQYQFMYGPALLAAPVYSWGKQRQVWFPPGEWIDFDSGTAYRGPQTTRVPAPIEKLPLFVRSGSVIPLREDRATDVLTLRLFAGDAPEPSTIRLRDQTEISFEPGATGGRLTITGPVRRYRLQMPHASRFAVGSASDSGSSGTPEVITGPISVDLAWDA
ncbi:MAG: glycoside hydrolase family 31 protein [Thermomicrobiales bacterium]